MALERLQEVGLSTYVYEKNKKFFIPTNPEKIPQILKNIEEEQREKVEKLKRKEAEILANLK